MANSGLVWFDEQNGQSRFRLAPFIVGVYEAQLDRMDHELAHLVEEYLVNGRAAGIMKPQPALHRVVPAQSAVKPEWILPYDDVRKILLASKTFGIFDCICRVQQMHIGRGCEFPLRTCLFFSSDERPASPMGVSPMGVSQEEALALLDKAEEIGLVHAVSNVIEGIGYVCNCCGCCCEMLRAINEYGIEKSVARANYSAVIDPDECAGCGTCVGRCQVHAISQKDDVAVGDLSRCIDCGLYSSPSNGLCGLEP